MLGIAQFGKKGSRRLCLDCCGGPIPESRTGGRTHAPQSRSPSESLKQFWWANGNGYPYRSRSLSHWVPADGTRPQPMRTDQNHFVVSRYVFARDGSTEMLQSHNKSMRPCQTA